MYAVVQKFKTKYFDIYQLRTGPVVKSKNVIYYHSIMQIF